MARWGGFRTRRPSPTVVIVAAALAVLLVAAVPVALLAGLILMVLGHVIGGLALFGGSILAAGAGVSLAGLSGVRYVRKSLREQGIQILRLKNDDYSYM